MAVDTDWLRMVAKAHGSPAVAEAADEIDRLRDKVKNYERSHKLLEEEITNLRSLRNRLIQALR